MTASEPAPPQASSKGRKIAIIVGVVLAVLGLITAGLYFIAQIVLTVIFEFFAELFFPGSQP